MAENNEEEKPQLLHKLFGRATSFPGNLSQNLPDPQNPAVIDAFEEFVYEDNDDVFQVRGYTYWSMEKSDSWKKTHEFVEGDRIQKTLSASRDSGIDGLHTEGNGANFEPPPQTSDLPMSDLANDSSHVELLADDSKHDNVPVNNEAPDESEEHTYERPDQVLFEGRSRLSTNSWQKRELRSIEEIELYEVEQTLKIFDKLKIVRRDSLRMDGMVLVGKDEKYFVSCGLKAFEARKLYKYVRGWRPKDHQQCNKDPFLTTINRWSTGDVQTVMQSLKLPQVGDFAVANQVDGLLLMDLVENKYMIDIEKDYGVKLSLLEYERLVPFLEEKRKEIGYLTAESVAKIMEKLQLVKHIDTFKQQNIDSEKLNQMSELQLTEIGLTVFEARKLYNYLNQGWRPKKRDHCHKNLKKRPVDEWSVNDVQTYLGLMKLSKLAKFAGDNQIDGVMLRDLVENFYLESLEHDYGVKISLGEFNKLNELLKGIQQVV